MSDPARYYFWNEGVEVQGPHTLEELRQLHGNGVIGAQTQLCPEGGTAWQPFDLALVLPPVRTMPPPPPVHPPGIHLQAGASPDSSLRWTGTNWWNRDTAGRHIGRKIFAAVAWLIMVSCSIIYIWGQRLLIPHLPSLSPLLVSLVPFLFVILWVVPFLLTILLPRWLRFWCRSSLIILFSFFTFVGAMGSFSSLIGVHTAVLALNQKGKALIDTSIETDRAVPSLDPANFKTMEDLTQAETAMLKLRSSFSDVLDYFTTYDQQVRDAVTPLHLSADLIDTEVAAAHKVTRVDELLALWRLKVQLCDHQISRLAFLEKTWGHWTVRDDRVIFEDDSQVDPYNILHSAVQKDAADFNAAKARFDAVTPAAR